MDHAWLKRMMIDYSVYYVTDSWLVSPAFTLGKEQSSIKFEHARKFGDLSQLSVNISTDKQNWTKLEVSAWPDGSSWDYVEATADISAFAGKTVYIGFRYTSTADAAATWEIKNFSVTSPGGSYEGEGPGPQPEAKTYTTIAAAKAAATADKVPSVLKFENVLVTYVNGLSTYLADDENGFLLYGNVENVATGDVVNIEVAGDLFLYNGMPELSVSEVIGETAIFREVAVAASVIVSVQTQIPTSYVVIHAKAKSCEWSSIDSHTVGDYLEWQIVHVVQGHHFGGILVG